MFVLRGSLLVDEIFYERERKKVFRCRRRNVACHRRLAERDALFRDRRDHAVLLIMAFRIPDVESEVGLCLLLL